CLGERRRVNYNVPRRGGRPHCGSPPWRERLRLRSALLLSAIPIYVWRSAPRVEDVSEPPRPGTRQNVHLPAQYRRHLRNPIIVLPSRIFPRSTRRSISYAENQRVWIRSSSISVWTPSVSPVAM